MDNKPVFRPSFGNKPDQLIGRDEVINMVEEGLHSYPGSAERADLIIGQRGMGKTALLLEIAERARGAGYVVARTTCGENMLDNIVELLQKEGSQFTKDEKKPIKGFSAGAMGFSLGLTFTEEAQRSFGFRVKLEMICEKLSSVGKHTLILVDEVDPSLEQMRELAAAYQELAGEEADIAIVMAGLPGAISGILNYKTLTFLNRAQLITLDYVMIPEVEAYYNSAFTRASIIADSEMIGKAAALTEGFPYKIQLIGSYLSKMSAGSIAVDDEMLKKAEAAATADIDIKVVRAMLNPLSDLDMAILKAMAQDKSATRISDLESRLNLTHGTVQTYRKRLIDAGVIRSPRRGEIEFVLPQMADYLRRTYDE